MRLLTLQSIRRLLTFFPRMKLVVSLSALNFSDPKFDFQHSSNLFMYIECVGDWVRIILALLF